MGERFKIFERFQEFHKGNTKIFELYRGLAQDLFIAGRKHYSSDALIHVLRFRYDVQTNAEDFKISNDYTAYYARMLAAIDTRFKEFFTLKMGDDSDLNFITEGDFKKVYCGEEVVKDHQLEMF